MYWRRARAGAYVLYHSQHVRTQVVISGGRLIIKRLCNNREWTCYLRGQRSNAPPPSPRAGPTPRIYNWLAMRRPAAPQPSPMETRCGFRNLPTDSKRSGSNRQLVTAGTRHNPIRWFLFIYFFFLFCWKRCQLVEGASGAGRVVAFNHETPVIMINQSNWTS